MSKTATAHEICELVNGSLEGDADFELTGINKIEEAGPGEISFLADQRYERFAASTQASCLLVDKKFKAASTASFALIRVNEPYRAFLTVARFFASGQQLPAGFRHPSAVIDAAADLADSVYVGAGVLIGANCSIAEDVILHPGAILYADVHIGAGSIIHGGVVCCEGTRIGQRCIINPGAVLGAEGFGFYEHKDGSFEKVPQTGRVVVGDDVEIGANTTIDRATMGATVIKNGVKIDNLVQVGHNASIGEHTGIVSQTGISGSTTVGRRNRIGGQVGMVGHISTADDVYIEAKSGIAKSIKESGKYFGAPAVAHSDHVKQIVALHQLPAILKEFRALQKTVHQLQRQAAENPSGTDGSAG